MGWITAILQALPAILAAISQLWAIIGPLINHQKAAALAAAGQAVSSTDYHVYVTGQAGLFTAVAAGLACCQPTANRAFRLLRQQSQRQAARLRAEELRNELASLPQSVQ